MTLMILFVFISTIISCLFHIAIIMLGYSYTKRSKLYKKVVAELEKVIKERDTAIEGLLEKEQ
ncbi:hypothetical protein BM1374166_01776 [Bartonella tribocorum]|uniref:hypothetical protein n=1 Tax=Bartonella tribocorum TaxID=85701 RepID=UPI00043AC846|nr:hypothetical protein [Bartonella tribocorum]CDO49429.1 hypothetical protein BM1374166_01776 [Bartonella tribocorum]